MTFEQFRNDVYVAVGTDVRLRDVPFEFDHTSFVWKRGALTIGLVHNAGTAIVVATRTMTALFGAGSTPFLPLSLDGDGVQQAVTTICACLDDPYQYQ